MLSGLRPTHNISEKSSRHTEAFPWIASSISITFQDTRFLFLILSNRARALSKSPLHVHIHKCSAQNNTRLDFTLVQAEVKLSSQIKNSQVSTSSDYTDDGRIIGHYMCFFHLVKHPNCLIKVTILNIPIDQRTPRNLILASNPIKKFCGCMRV